MGDLKTMTGTAKALAHSWWINVYPDGAISNGLFRTKDAALDACTWSSDPLRPDAEQIEVRIVVDNMGKRWDREASVTVDGLIARLRAVESDYAEHDDDRDKWLATVCRESADEMERLRAAVVYIDRQVREVWNPVGLTYQSVHRAWCMEKAREVLDGKIHNEFP